MGVSHGYTNSQRLYTMGQADRGDASTVGVPVGQDPDLELGQGDIDVGEGRQPEAAGICAFFGGLLCYLFFCPCVGVCVCFNQLWAWITGEETGVTLEHPNSTTPLQLVRMDSNGTQAVDNMAKPGQVEVERMRRDLLKRQDPNQLVICRLCSGSGVLEVDLMTSPVACQMCAGSGTVSSWSSAFEAPEAEDDSSCPICFGPSKYGISTECSHFFCPDCIRGSLGAMLDQGVFPCLLSGVSSRGQHRRRENTRRGPYRAGCARVPRAMCRHQPGLCVPFPSTAARGHRIMKLGEC